jgi:hypothetical protein
MHLFIPMLELQFIIIIITKAVIIKVLFRFSYQYLHFIFFYFTLHDASIVRWIIYFAYILIK